LNVGTDLPARRELPTHSAEHDAFGRAVRLERARREMSQEELGFRARLHRNYVGAVERGEINPTLRVMLKFAHGLEVPLSQLIADAERYEQTGRL
jgi:transcriptional regulator with XRE-family HTH domain